jgi:hypothetical protein
MTEKSDIENKNDFSEKCRTALERSWGITIPTPKTLLKKG